MLICCYSLELELPGELVLSLFQLLSARHVLVVHVLDLRFDALELGIELGEKGGGQTERVRRREVSQCSVVANRLVSNLLQLGFP